MWSEITENTNMRYFAGTFIQVNRAVVEEGRQKSDKDTQPHGKPVYRWILQCDKQ